MKNLNISGRTQLISMTWRGRRKIQIDLASFKTYFVTQIVFLSVVLQVKRLHGGRDNQKCGLKSYSKNQNLQLEHLSGYILVFIYILKPI